MTSPRWLIARSLLWTVLLPGFFAGYLPWRYFGVGHVSISWNDPRHLIGLMAILIGGALLAAIYRACCFVAANLFVIGYEEPALLERFGPSYERYRGSVSRWLPRRPTQSG